MKFAPKHVSRAPKLAMTSMLDVIFLLLCFFVTASYYARWESDFSIQLPTASNSTAPKSLPCDIVVNLAKDGTVSVNSRVLTLDDLGTRLAKIARFYPGQTVIIRSDKAASYESLVRLIDVCRGAGVCNFSFATAEAPK